MRGRANILQVKHRKFDARLLLVGHQTCPLVSHCSHSVSAAFILLVSAADGSRTMTSQQCGPTVEAELSPPVAGVTAAFLSLISERRFAAALPYRCPAKIPFPAEISAAPRRNRPRCRVAATRRPLSGCSTLLRRNHRLGPPADVKLFSPHLWG